MKSVGGRASERALVSYVYRLVADDHCSFGVQPIREGSYVPDLVIFLNPPENLSAIRECTSKNIPTVGIVDTDTDPRLVTYPIPANMEVSQSRYSFRHSRRAGTPANVGQSVRTAELILSTLTIAGQEGRRLRMQNAVNTKVGGRK